MFGSHMLKSWSRTQSVVALSSGEAEYYGLVKGASTGLGMLSMYADFGLQLNLELKCDASAACGIARRKGLGKIRHIEVCQLWLQDFVAQKKIQFIKVPGSSNLSDHLTKYLNQEGIEAHMKGTNQRIEKGRHALMPEVAE